jgi:hypothetical protein
MVNGIWLALLGILAVPSLILAKRPDAKEMLAKIAPFQGWIGVVSAFWGVWLVLNMVLHIGVYLHFPVTFATLLADGVLQAGLGFILGIGTMKTFIKDPTAQAKMDETLTKLAPHQGRLGLVAVCVGGWMAVGSILGIIHV